MDYLRTRGEENGRSDGISENLGAMDKIDQEIRFNEKPRDPVLWTIFSIFVPFVLW